MSKEIQEKRRDKTKNDISRAFCLSMVIVFAMVISFTALTLMPHKGESNDIITFYLWEYARNNLMFLLGGILISVFLALFGYWSYEDSKLLKEQRKALICEMIQEELKKEG